MSISLSDVKLFIVKNKEPIIINISQGLESIFHLETLAGTLNLKKLRVISHQY